MKVLAFREYRKNTLQGFAEVELPSGMRIRDLSLHERNGERWIAYPAKQFTKEDGSQGWLNLVYFADRKVNGEFQKSVLAALDAFRNRREPDGEVRF